MAVTGLGGGCIADPLSKATPSDVANATRREQVKTVLAPRLNPTRLTPYGLDANMALYPSRAFA